MKETAERFLRKSILFNNSTEKTVHLRPLVEDVCQTSLQSVLWFLTLCGWGNAWYLKFINWYKIQKTLFDYKTAGKKGLILLQTNDSMGLIVLNLCRKYVSQFLNVFFLNLVVLDWLIPIRSCHPFDFVGQWNWPFSVSTYCTLRLLKSRLTFPKDKKSKNPLWLKSIQDIDKGIWRSCARILRITTQGNVFSPQ